MNVRLKTQQDKEKKEKAELWSRVPCTFCGTEFAIKNLRQKNPLCTKCKPYKASLERNHYFHGTQHTEQQRKEILKRDRTVAVGPFFKVKN